MGKLWESLKQDFVRTLTMLLLIFVFGGQIAGFISKNSVPDYFVETIHKLDVVYMYSTDEMVRFVEKQYTKVTEKPDDFYASDLIYCFDSIWPNIPDNKKTQSLLSKYNYLLQYYEDNISRG